MQEGSKRNGMGCHIRMSSAHRNGRQMSPYYTLNFEFTLDLDEIDSNGYLLSLMRLYTF